MKTLLKKQFACEPQKIFLDENSQEEFLPEEMHEDDTGVFILSKAISSVAFTRHTLRVMESGAEVSAIVLHLYAMLLGIRCFRHLEMNFERFQCVYSSMTSADRTYLFEAIYGR